LSRYPKFFRSLLDNPIHEVAVLARLVGKDAITTTGKNLLNLKLETGLDVATAPLSQVNSKLCSVNLPAASTWKLYLLEKYLGMGD
jgi:hypothetical protein